jgi:low affinity Fe/Cu permease
VGIRIENWIGFGKVGIGKGPTNMTPTSQASANSRIVPKTQRLTRSSRWLHKVDHYTSQPWATLLLGVILVSVIVLGAVLGFPASWTTAFEVGASFITLMMLVIIQHSQGREQTATQRKLDELLRALPQAESTLILLEEESDETMQAVEENQRQTKQG